MKTRYLRLHSFFLFSCMSLVSVQGQTIVPINNLEFFRNPGPSWSIAGDVSTGFAEHAILSLSPGSGILANLSNPDHPGTDIFSKQLFGGVDVEADFMLTRGSNSGIYLQGRYEVQLRDSWGTVLPTSADNGGICERWDESKPDGLKGYDGHAPRQSVSRAPGLWQHIKISFQAPRFNASGQRIEKARILRVELNGVTVQENIELSGPTRDAIGQDEVPLGPLRIQGDQGSVAFKNMKVIPYNNPPPELSNLQYEIFNGRFEDDLSFKKLQPDKRGKTEKISMNIATFPPLFLIRFSGVLNILQAGKYHFGTGLSGGSGALKINGKDVVLFGKSHDYRSGDIELTAGNFPFEMIYSKLSSWGKPGLSVDVSGPEIRLFTLSDANAGTENENPILLQAPVNTILRSFSDIDTFKITHAVNVGSPLQIHYTYDMDKGTIAQVWRGDFLDVSSMWQGRGDGTSHPLGMIVQFGRPVPFLEKLANPVTSWSSDTSSSGFRPKGYILNGVDMPEFKYLCYGSLITDSISVLPGGKGIHRKILIDKPTDQLYLKMATASTIEKTGKNIYIMDHKTYYIQIDDPGMGEPLIRDAGGKKELIVPVSGEFSYSILF